jgi:Protein of unknown function (DUF1064)
MATRGWENVEPGGLVRRAVPVSRPPKYRNTKTEIGGLRFDSRAEGHYWLKLRDREARNEIYDLHRQVSFPLFTAVAGHRDVMRVLVCEYLADFVYFEAGQRHVVDVKRKATQTAVYRLKRKWLELQDGIVIEEVSW